MLKVVESNSLEIPIVLVVEVAIEEEQRRFSNPTTKVRMRRKRLMDLFAMKARRTRV